MHVRKTKGACHVRRESTSLQGVLEATKQTHLVVDEAFGSMTLDELRGPDGYDETEFDSVIHRLLYGLRHGQYHIGRLAAYLDQEGISFDAWRG